MFDALDSATVTCLNHTLLMVYMELKYYLVIRSRVHQDAAREGEDCVGCIAQLPH